MPYQLNFENVTVDGDTEIVLSGTRDVRITSAINTPRIIGISNGADAQLMAIQNLTANSVTLVNASGAVSQANRKLLNASGGDWVIRPNQTLRALSVDPNVESGTFADALRGWYIEVQQRVWKDLLVPLVPPAAGLTIPVVTQIASSAISAPLWALNDQMWVFWHIQHDYALGTDIHFHVHWLADGTNVNTVKWQFTYYHAKGHGQAAFALGGGGTVVSATQASAGQYYHMIAETAGVSIAGLEPDSVIACEIKRVTNGGTDNTDNIFGFQADLHYLASEIGTRNKSPNFYI